MSNTTNTSTLTPKRTSPVRAGATCQPVDRHSSSHKLHSVKCKLPSHFSRRRGRPAGRDEIKDHEALAQAKLWAQWLVHDEAKHARDVRGAMERLESQCGIPAGVFYTWWHRSQETKSIDRKVHLALAQVFARRSRQVAAKSTQLASEAEAVICGSGPR